VRICLHVVDLRIENDRVRCIDASAIDGVVSSSAI